MQIMWWSYTMLIPKYLRTRGHMHAHTEVIRIFTLIYEAPRKEVNKYKVLGALFRLGQQLLLSARLTPD